MNKLLLAVFQTETAAEAGQKALRALHTAGDITLYATGIIGRDINGVVSVRKSLDQGLVGTATGLAVGSLIGLLGGPVGFALGAVTGTVTGAVRDFWVAGVGLDFIEESEKHLAPGTVALLAEIEEEWVIPVDTALEAAGGQVFRRTRSEVAEARFDHDIAAIESEVAELEAEISQAGGAARTALQARLTDSRTSPQAAVQHAAQRVDALKQEAEAKTESLKLQMSQASGDVRDRIEDRMHRVTRAYHSRGAKLAQAWSLTKEALTV